ncbi:hypothetical protein PYCCODRAFT_1464253 [Trametes coccinea BRFM310]|uniref:Uncharacterized protein n=1 Tax=Trametes coccinea (strain BRFM310) TaxID=1353009 RepID=A0A1Y2IYY7_TRAC3|nr:hypothetical protein PYCCODRAFT_1464253 [Trametes coccinea BRFM310]
MVRVRSGGAFKRSTKSTIQHIARSSERPLEAFQIRLEQISGLSFEERDLLQQMEIDPLDDGLDLDDGCLPPLPPGEEGMFFSHAGSDAELFNELFTGDTKSYILI